MNINLSNVKELSYIEEAGEYELTVKEFKAEVNAKGTMFHRFKCEDDQGRRITVSLPITEDSMWKYKKFLKGCGHPGEGNIDTEILSPKCIGSTFIGVVAKQKPKINIMTGVPEESKYLDVINFKIVDA